MTTEFGRRTVLAGLATTAMTPLGARAQAFPTGRVTLVVPFPPGASTDISTRILADRLTQMWGQPVLIDNKGGGNGIIAAEAVMRAKPDGYTILATSSSSAPPTSRSSNAKERAPAGALSTRLAKDHLMNGHLPSLIGRYASLPGTVASSV